MKCSLGISNFLKRSLIFPILFFPSISLHWSLWKAFLSLLAILWNSAFKWVYLFFSPLLFTSLLFTAICKAFSDSHFAFLHFFPWGWSWSLSPVQGHEPHSIVHQALYLSDLVTLNTAAINMSVQTLVWDPAFDSFGCVLRSEIVGPHDNPIFNFFRNWYTIFHSSYIILYSHQLYTRVLIFPLHHQHFLIVVILMDVKWYITVCMFLKN